MGRLRDRLRGVQVFRSRGSRRIDTTPCSDWTTQNGTPGSDHACYGGDGTVKIPAALVRGGAWSSGAFAGPLDVDTADPTSQAISLGCRCVR